MSLGFLLFVLLALTVSSLTVAGATPDVEAAVTVQPVGGRGNRSSRVGPNFSPAHFYALSTSPFGRTYRVDAEGYVPATVTVFPGLGRYLRLGKDVAASPSVLFRPPPGALRSLKNQGRWIIYRLNREQQRWDSIAGLRDSTALLLGREQPTTLRPEWEMELSFVDETTRKTTLLTWLKPKVVTLRPPPGTGTVLLGAVYTGAGVLVASERVTLRGERMMDVPLRESAP